jgi:alpha-L-fucosidase
MSFGWFAAGMLFGSAPVGAAEKYEPTWESLDKHQTPKWFMDAKVGLFVYPLHPTLEEFQQYFEERGQPGKTHKRRDTWDEVPWDPEGIAQLAVDAGAKYVVFGIDPFSVFLVYPSKYADIEGSPFVKLGAIRSGGDHVGEMAKAVRGKGMRFGIYRNYCHPKKYPYFLETTYELIDRYQPVTLWLDGDKLSYPADELRSKELAAYYYNHSKKPDEVALEDALGSYKQKTWGTSLTHGDWFRKEMSPPHAEIADGYFVRYETLYRWGNRSPVGDSRGISNNLIEWLIDAVAKNGNIELTIHLGPKELFELEKRTLRAIGIWLEANGEAIYETRPWHDGTPESVTPSGIHVRYTTKDDSLYAILFDWPQSDVLLPHLAADPATRMKMLGATGELQWRQTDDGVSVSRPGGSGASGMETEIPCDHAFVIRITPKPKWSKAPKRESTVVQKPPPPPMVADKPDLTGAKQTVLQIGLDGYEKQSNEQLTAGGWGAGLGYIRHGDVNEADSLFVCKHDRPNHAFTAHSLIRFDLTDRVPDDVTIKWAELVLRRRKDFAAATLEWYEVLKPWRDGETYWRAWGDGGSEEGYLGALVASVHFPPGEQDLVVGLPPEVIEKWLKDVGNNHGLLVKMKEGEGVHMSFKGSASEVPPKLIIYWVQTGKAD